MYIKSGVDLKKGKRTMKCGDKTIELHYFKKAAYTDSWIDLSKFAHDKVFLFQEGTVRPVRFGSVF